MQLAKLSGFSPIITTASKHNEALVKSLGATHVIDRNTPLALGIKAITNDPIKIVYDAISETDTQNASYDVLAPGGKLILVLPLQVEQTKLTEDKELVDVYGTGHDPAQRAVGVSLYKNLTKLLESGEIKVRRTDAVCVAVH